MALSKGALRTLIRAHLTDSEKQIWSDGLLDVVISESYDELWGEIIDMAPWYSSIAEVIPPATILAPGYIAINTALTGRWYKVQAILRDGQQYSPAAASDASRDFYSEALTGNSPTGPQFTYTIFGTKLVLFPFSTTSAITIQYSFLPPTFITLLDTANIFWPDGFENALVFEVLTKVVDDLPRLQKFQALHDRSFDRLLSRVRREYAGPAVENTSNDLIAWGSI